ncbi:MAG TPA: HI0074 family nucleotidyltransferase substrate-binding subunit [Mucilaginibacter sp.]|jgi:nucleotidyltransferase substrate binding protein (TIGR01987 family)|nr:HI0074 family nucleotidyltransferase substrate-binding subunit [Mucilaginibacter sp.]
MIDYEKFEKSLRHLKAQFDNYKTIDNREDLGQLEREAIAESVIQRFEVCYDSLWKVLKRYLIEELGIPDVPNSPKPVINIAFENQLFNSSVKQWLKYAEARTDTSHDYSENKAFKALELMGDFIDDAIDLYIIMSGKIFE